jgi:hypothetical protein
MEIAENDYEWCGKNMPILVVAICLPIVFLLRFCLIIQDEERLYILEEIPLFMFVGFAGLFLLMSIDTVLHQLFHLLV